MALAQGLTKRAGGVRSASVSRRTVNPVRCSVFSAKNAAQRSAEVGREWLETILSRFGPATDRAQNITTLDFEKPLSELDKRIKEVGARQQVQTGQALCCVRRSQALHACSDTAGPQSSRGKRR